MSASGLRIVTRKSPLAMWQADHVRGLLLQRHPGLQIDIIGVTTQADTFGSRPLHEMGGKGAFVKELEEALISGAADLAVHSMKDVTVDLPGPLAIAVVLERADVRDAWVSERYPDFDALPAGARVGTSSLRRRCQLLAARPDAVVLDVRGNVDTRLAKLDAGDYDGLILAAAGLERLGLEARIAARLPADTWLPAIGQGAVGVEVRADDQETCRWLAPLDHPATHACVATERAMNRRLGGGCHVPVAGLAESIHGSIQLRALVGRVDGSKTIRATISGPVAEGEQLGEELGSHLLGMGADEILREFSHGGDA